MTQVRVCRPGCIKDAEEWNRGYMSRLARRPAALQLPPERRTARRATAGTIPSAVGKRRRTASAARNCAATSPGISSRQARNCMHRRATRRPRRRAITWWRNSPRCQQKLGGGYLSAFPMELFDRLDALSGEAARSGYRLRTAASRRCRGRRSTPSTRSWPGCSTCTSWPATSRRWRLLEGMADWADPWTALKDRRAHAGDSEHGVRRHGGDRCTTWRRSPTTIAGPRRATASPRSALSIRWRCGATNCAACT